MTLTLSIFLLTMFTIILGSMSDVANFSQPTYIHSHFKFRLRGPNDVYDQRLLCKEDVVRGNCLNAFVRRYQNDCVVLTVFYFQFFVFSA